VSTALDEHAAGIESPALTPELLDASLWQAARDGMAGDLVNPSTGTLASAEAVAQALVDYVSAALAVAGDDAFVAAGLDRILTEGTGAERQRAAFRSQGADALRALFGAAFPAPVP
jgi:carboxylate-amine ligase